MSSDLFSALRTCHCASFRGSSLGRLVYRTSVAFGRELYPSSRHTAQAEPQCDPGRSRQLPTQFLKMITHGPYLLPGKKRNAQRSRMRRGSRIEVSLVSQVPGSARNVHGERTRRKEVSRRLSLLLARELVVAGDMALDQIGRVPLAVPDEPVRQSGARKVGLRLRNDSLLRPSVHGDV